MRVDTAILCDHASVREGLLNIISGGVTRMTRSNFPASMGMSVGLMLAAPERAEKTEGALTISVKNEADESVATANVTFTAGTDDGPMPGTEWLIPLAVSMQEVKIPSPGTYSLVVSTGDGNPRTLWFTAVQG